MEILDQDGEGKEAQIEDIKRVLKNYSKMTTKEIDHFIEINQGRNDRDTLKNFYKRVSNIDPEKKIEIE